VVEIKPLWQEDQEFQQYRAMVERDPVGAQAFSIKTMDETRQAFLDHVTQPVAIAHPPVVKGTTPEKPVVTGKVKLTSRDIIILVAGLVIIITGGASAIFGGLIG